MRFLLVLFTLIFAAQAMATDVDTMIHDIDPGTNAEEETLIFLTSGVVVTLRADEKSALSELQEGLREKTWFRISYNSEREIESIKEIANPFGLSTALKSRSSQKMLSLPYQASILKDMDAARSFFYDARIKHKESQCYNRAHGWTYDWRTKRNLYSNKTWLFFTKRFIRKYKFEWWFHVAPSVLVHDSGEVRERVMDMKYARGPLKLKTWTNIFMRDNADCPVVQKYSDHANFPESGSCFVMRSSMYYYQPVDLEQLELTGVNKEAWIEPEVRHAFEEAFEVQL